MTVTITHTTPADGTFSATGAAAWDAAHAVSGLDNALVSSIGYTIDGNGNVITTGIAGAGIRLPFAGTINSVTLLADVSGTIQIDILKGTYSGYIFTSGSICASALPALSSAVKYEDTTLTGWTTAFSAGDVFRFQVTTSGSFVPASVTNVAIILKVTKS